MSGHDGFWDNLLNTGYVGQEEFDTVGNYLKASERENAEGVLRVESQVEDRMTGKSLEGRQFNSVRNLTDKFREENALRLPVTAGTRVEFATNLGSLMSYENPPEPHEVGVVVNVKSATGDVTSHDGKVFVEWSGGRLLPVYAEHLSLAHGSTRTGNPNIIRVACLGDLSDFMKIADDTLIHKATKDLWAVKQEGGEYIIERLFDDTGTPLKG